MPLWLWPNILSLDAPAIAVLWQTLLARSLHLRLDRWEPAVLAVCVWFVYVTDHWLDVVRLPRGPWEPVRKVLYRCNRRLATIAASCLLVVAACSSILLLSPRVIYAGLALVLWVLFYLVLVHLLPVHWRMFWPRELAVALFFTAGSFLAIAVAPGIETGNLLAPAILLTSLGWANSSAIEEYESGRGATGPNVSVHVSTSWLANHLVFAGLAIAFLAFLFDYSGMVLSEFAAATATSGLALSLLALYSTKLPPDFVPVAADLALCTPVLVLVFTAWA